MLRKATFDYLPADYECEKASNAYVMSLIAVMAGMPIPIVNLLATVGFYFAQRKGSYFVRWHAMQALLSQLVLLFTNSYLFWWTIAGFLGNRNFSQEYFYYLGFVVLLNIFELGGSIYAAVLVRKGHHIRWFVLADLCDAFVKRTKYQ